MTTLINRMSKNLKAEAVTAVNKIEIDGYTVQADNTIVCDEDQDGSFYEIWFYRNGNEVIAVPDFYINEGGSMHTGSRGGEYTLNGETLTAGW
mgnify:CR=1 FL=1